MRRTGPPGEPAEGDISKFPRVGSEGDRGALEKLTPIVYDESHRLARRYSRRERPGRSLPATAPVHEAYVRLAVYDRAHFFAGPARSMRRIPVEQARRHNVKREGAVEHVSLDEASVVGGGRASDLVTLDDAMNALGRLDQRKVQVVELRFFGGLSVEETAQALKVPPVTAMRDRSTAEAWLNRELTGGTGDEFRSMETSR